LRSSACHHLGRDDTASLKFHCDARSAAADVDPHDGSIDLDSDWFP